MKRMIPVALFCLAMLSGKAQEAATDYNQYATGTGFLHPGYPQCVHGGDEVTISCRPDSAVEGPIRAVLYVYDTLYRWHVYEYVLKRSADSLAASVRIPGATGFIAYKFLYGGKTDNNGDKGYFSMGFRKGGAYLPGAEAGYGLIRSPGYDRGVPNYFEHFSISDTATYMWLSNEILRQGPRAARRLAIPYLTAESRWRPGKAKAEMMRAVNFLLRVKDSTDETYTTAWLICRDLLKDSSRADSLRGVLLREFPRGGVARLIAYNKAIHARSQEDKMALCSAFVKDFPYEPAEQEENTALTVNYSTVYRALTMIAIAGEHREIVLAHMNALPFSILTEVYYKAVEIPYDDWKKEDAKTVYPYSRALYDRMLYYYAHAPAEYWYYAPSEWKAYCEQIYRNCFRLHARILMEIGQTKEALALAERAQASYRYHNADLDQTESLLLEKLGRRAGLDSVLMASVRLNQVTPAMLRLLHTLYKGKEADFDGWFESLKGPEAQEELLTQIRRAAMNRQAPAFTLKDADGNEVRLGALRGKVVVLDFWATWCAPCKAAMAGMKLAKDRLKGDTNVVFYFIDTQERSADFRTKSLAFLKEKGYDFTVLYDDGVRLDSVYATYATALHTSGIPFKAIIDGKGMLRFSNIGYMGSPSGLADEMVAMVAEAEKTSGGGAMSRGRAAGGYLSDSVLYGHDSIRIGATLSYPVSRKADAAVVILSGTGKQDRDGTMAGHKLFAVLADSLTRSGFVVLRSDDRGVGVSNGDYDLSTTEDFAKDAEAAVAYLKCRKDLRIGKIGLLGHSEGGMSAGMAAAEDKDIDFVITLSSPGTTGLQALLLQNRTLVHSAPIPAINQLRFDSINSLLFHLVAANPDVSSARLDTMLRTAYRGWKVWDDSVVAANHLAYGGHFFFPLESYIRQATGPWYRGFIAYDPSVVLPKVHVPWLALNGDKDVISDGAVNLRGIADNLFKGGNQAVTTWLVPGVNHLYQHCVRCTTSEYSSLRETVAPEVVARIEAWLKNG